MGLFMHKIIKILWKLPSDYVCYKAYEKNSFVFRPVLIQEMFQYEYGDTAKSEIWTISGPMHFG
jgi:hypothetical protein